MKLRLFYSLFMLFSCSVKYDKIPGVYTLKKKDVKEILILKKDFTYKRTIYNLNTSHLLLEFNGEWGAYRNKIWLKNFFKPYANNDLYKKYIDEGKKDDRLYHTSLFIKKIFNKIYIEISELGKVVMRYEKE